MKQSLFAFVMLAICGPVVGADNGESGMSTRFRALKYMPAPRAGTWKIHDRDGANRQVDPYLSSLGWGEGGTGVVRSPAFTLQADSISFTFCGHDGPEGKGKKNYVALIDAASGEALHRSYAPGSDPMQPGSWDVKDLGGRKVCFEAHDDDTAGAYAWLGVGAIDAGPGLRIDFREGLPDTWKVIAREQGIRAEIVEGGIPFRSVKSHYSMVPESGPAGIPCGFRADRLFFLGGTVYRASPLETCGWIEIRYHSGASERVPLLYGFTLDGAHKLRSPSRALYLHPSGDAFQSYFVVKPRREVIDSLRLERGEGHPVPRITAVTCETDARGDSLLPLPDCQPGAEEKAWIESHTITPGTQDLNAIKERIRKAHGLLPPEGPRVLHFEKHRISERTYEAASVVDIDGDGHKDIVSGAYWYRGPDFSVSVKITDVAKAGEYWDDFSDYPMDVNGDGFPDIVTGAFFGGPLRWLENPRGATSTWEVHPIEDVGPIETTRFWDVDGDGVVEVCPNAGGNVVFYRLVLDGEGRGAGKFTRHEVRLGGCGHGLGFGDINGDGRGDFVVPDAWIEAPEDPLHGEWVWRDDGFRLGTASVPILVYDVNEDEKADLIVGQAHGYGLDWYEQSVGGSGGRTWIRHRIDRGSSQYHDMLLEDIDRDGQPELITGKRYRAHNGHDPGSEDPLFVRYFEIENGAFICHTVDYGPPERSSGVGIHFWVEDVDGNDWKDIVAPGKEGLHLFRNLGKR